MTSALRNTDVTDVQFYVTRDGGGRVGCMTSVGSSVVNLDRSQEPPVPDGAQLLDSFLDEFEALEALVPHLEQASKDVGEVFAQADKGVTMQVLRLRAGLSQSQLAEKIGTSQAAVSDYERRIKKPNEEKIRALKNALNVDFNSLMDALAHADS